MSEALVNGPPVLRTQSLVVGYPEQPPLVSGVSLTVHPGELWAVLGPNGAGKSTLLRSVLGLMPLLGGQVEVCGQGLEGWTRRGLAQRVAYLPQHSDVDEGFTGRELVGMGRAPHQGGLMLASHADRAAVDEVLEELGVTALADRSSQALSGGEQRLLFLARALVQAPTLLVMDEPTAFLDLRHQVEVLQRVHARVRKGLSVLTVLHDVNLAAGFADHVLLLGRGEVRGQGRTEELLTADRLEELYGLPMAASTTSSGQRLFAPRYHP